MWFLGTGQIISLNTIRALGFLSLAPFLSLLPPFSHPSCKELKTMKIHRCVLTFFLISINSHNSIEHYSNWHPIVHTYIFCIYFLHSWPSMDFAYFPFAASLFQFLFFCFRTSSANQNEQITLAWCSLKDYVRKRVFTYGFCCCCNIIFNDLMKYSITKLSKEFCLVL